MKVQALLYVLLSALVTEGHVHMDCGTEPEVSAEDAGRRERRLFGKLVNNMTRNDYSDILQSVARRGESGDRRNLQDATDHFVLVDIPIEFHVLTGQTIQPMFGTEGPPHFTAAQAEKAIAATNERFNIYDPVSGTSVQWATFVNGGTTYHDSFITDKDCNDLTIPEIENIIIAGGGSAIEIQTKLQVFVCTTSQYWGFALYPDSPARPSDVVYHNLIRMHWMSFGCYDDDGTFICETQVDGEDFSYSDPRWSPSVSLAHEIGHTFGLRHLFDGGGCFGRGDEVADTPRANARRALKESGCHGLLPFDKDRDLTSWSGQRLLNVGNAETCGGEDKVCGETCGACCILPGTDAMLNISFTETNKECTQCCDVFQTQPVNTCFFFPGVDAKTNVMAIVNDYCRISFTPGQMARMMAQTVAYKFHIYCNYADNTELVDCTRKRIGCSSTATSPRCA